MANTKLNMSPERKRVPNFSIENGGTPIHVFIITDPDMHMAFINGRIHLLSDLIKKNFLIGEYILQYVKEKMGADAYKSNDPLSLLERWLEEAINKSYCKLSVADVSIDAVERRSYDDLMDIAHIKNVLRTGMGLEFDIETIDQRRFLSKMITASGSRWSKESIEDNEKLFVVTIDGKSYDCDISYNARPNDPDTETKKWRFSFTAVIGEFMLTVRKNTFTELLSLIPSVLEDLNTALSLKNHG